MEEGASFIFHITKEQSFQLLFVFNHRLNVSRPQSLKSMVHNITKFCIGQKNERVVGFTVFVLISSWLSSEIKSVHRKALKAKRGP